MTHIADELAFEFPVDGDPARPLVAIGTVSEANQAARHQANEL